MKDFLCPETSGPALWPKIILGGYHSPIPLANQPDYEANHSRSCNVEVKNA